MYCLLQLLHRLQESISQLYQLLSLHQLLIIFPLIELNLLEANSLLRPLPTPLNSTLAMQVVCKSLSLMRFLIYRAVQRSYSLLKVGVLLLQRSDP
jgi:hypothetical protein